MVLIPEVLPEFSGCSVMHAIVKREKKAFLVPCHGIHGQHSPVHRRLTSSEGVQQQVMEALAGELWNLILLEELDLDIIPVKKLRR